MASRPPPPPLPPVGGTAHMQAASPPSVPHPGNAITPAPPAPFSSGGTSNSHATQGNMASSTALRRSELDDEIQEMDLGAELDVR